LSATGPLGLDEENEINLFIEHAKKFGVAEAEASVRGNSGNSGDTHEWH
jgi:hypothetical protein